MSVLTARFSHLTVVDPTVWFSADVESWTLCRSSNLYGESVTGVGDERRTFVHVTLLQGSLAAT